MKEHTHLSPLIRLAMSAFLRCAHTQRIGKRTRSVPFLRLGSGPIESPLKSTINFAPLPPSTLTLIPGTARGGSAVLRSLPHCNRPLFLPLFSKGVSKKELWGVLRRRHRPFFALFPLFIPPLIGLRVCLPLFLPRSSDFSPLSGTFFPIGLAPTV